LRFSNGGLRVRGKTRGGKENITYQNVRRNQTTERKKDRWFTCCGRGAGTGAEGPKCKPAKD